MMGKTFRAAEFDCAECARHIIDCSSDVVREPALCAACIGLPGWYRIAGIRALIDPEHDGLEIWEREARS